MTNSVLLNISSLQILLQDNSFRKINQCNIVWEVLLQGYKIAHMTHSIQHKYTIWFSIMIRTYYISMEWKEQKQETFCKEQKT